jgi:hypothetical protein
MRSIFQHVVLLLLLVVAGALLSMIRAHRPNIDDGQWINGRFVAGHFENVQREDGTEGYRSVFVPD